jgi:hypothetical protein
MEQRINNQELRIAVDFDKLKSEFATNVQVEITDDHVILSFLQSFPSAPADQPNAKIVSRIALTWLHFSKLTKVLSEIHDKQKGLAIDNFVNTVINNGENPNGMEN